MRIKNLRTKKNYTQAQLAEIADCLSGLQEEINKTTIIPKRGIVVLVMQYNL